MGKKILTMLLAACIGVVPVQVFGATQNYIPYISKAKVDEVVLGQITIDNSEYDLKAGQFFKLKLINAEFDLTSNDRVRIRSSSIEFEDGYKDEVVGMVKEDVTGGGTINISFHTKLLGGPAQLVIDSFDSGLTAGTYTYAISGDIPASYKGQVQKIEPVLLETTVLLDPIVIKEPQEASFRSIQMYNSDNKELLKLELTNPKFELRNPVVTNVITFVVDDGEDKVVKYRYGEDPEVEFNQKDNVITFTKEKNDIFNLEGKNYSITIENLMVRAMKPDELEPEVELKISGELVENQKIIVAYQDTPKRSEKDTVSEQSDTTPEQPDIPTPELPKPETPEPIKAKVDFIVGKNIYKVDGVSHSIDAKPYISSHNRIMVPVRYVAYALGVEENDLQWDGKSGTITIKADSPITINLGTKEMTKDSVITTLSEIKVVDGRTFVPVGEIAKAFGSNVTWDQIGKIATFK